MISLIGGGRSPRAFVAPVIILRALIAGDGAGFSAQLDDDSVFRVLDDLDERTLDEACAQIGAVSLLRRIHENVEFIGFQLTRMKWIAGGVAYEGSAVLRNWGFGPSLKASISVEMFFAAGAIRYIDLRMNGEAYLDLVHDGRAPRFHEAPRQARRVGL